MIAPLEPLQDLTPLLDGKCPDCCAERFLAGPEGGLAQNVECAECGARFNVCPRCSVLPGGFVERIGARQGELRPDVLPLLELVDELAWCPLCELLLPERELLDGEACPRCKYVIPAA